MTFIQTIPADEATGPLQELNTDDLQRLGYLANYTQVFSLRPEAMLAWRQLIGPIRANMPLRRYELVTIAAAEALGGAYCLLAHGAVLCREFFTAEQVAAIVRDYRQAGLAPEEVAVMAFAEKVRRQANSVTPQDIETLRAHGAEPDAGYRDMAPELGVALAQGRVFEAARE